jgi:hypothetical protein
MIEMNKEQVMQVVSSLQRVQGLPASISEKVSELERRIQAISDEQFEKWTDGVVSSAAQEEDRHWGIRTQIQELHSELSGYMNITTRQASGDATQCLQQLEGIVNSYQQKRV